MSNRCLYIANSSFLVDAAIIYSILLRRDIKNPAGNLVATKLGSETETSSPDKRIPTKFLPFEDCAEAFDPVKRET